MGKKNESMGEKGVKGVGREIAKGVKRKGKKESGKVSSEKRNSQRGKVRVTAKGRKSQRGRRESQRNKAKENTIITTTQKLL